MRAYQKPGRPPCAIDGCVGPLYCRGYCVMHYSRLRAGIEPFAAPEPLRAAPGEGSVIPGGYRMLNLPAHPLAKAQGKVPEHRVVLFAKIGEGEHPCHWCGKALQWDGVRQSLKIMADHVDHDRLNNAPSNLVPSCLDCNTKRRRKPPTPRTECLRGGHQFTPENTRTDSRGRRSCRACAREREDRDREKNRQRSREYYLKNRETILARLRADRRAAA